MKRNICLIVFAILPVILMYLQIIGPKELAAEHSRTMIRSFAIEEKDPYPCGPADIQTLDYSLQQNYLRDESHSKLFKVHPVILSIQHGEFYFLKQVPLIKADNHLSTITCILRI